MNKKLINQAIKALMIHDVCLHESKIWINEKYDPLFSEYESLSFQTRHGPRDSHVMEVKGDTIEKSQRFLRVRYDCAFRFASPDLTDEMVDNEDEAQKHILAEVHASFTAYYYFRDELIKEAIDEFAKFNAGYHVWPYWREYASSIASRMRFPPISIPLYTLPEFNDSDTDSSSDATAQKQ